LLVLLFLGHAALAQNASTPYTDFTYDTVPCQTQSVTFKSTVMIPDATQDRIIKYEWRLFNRVIGNTANQPYRFDAGGNYNVTLVVATQKGFKDSITKKITILQEPLDNNWSVTIKDDNLTKPGMHILTAKATPAGAKAYFQGYYNPTDSIAVVSPGYYIAQVKDACGVTRATDTVEVRSANTSPWKFTATGWYNDNCRTSATLKATTNAPAGQYTVTWNNGHTGDSITVTASDSYVATFRDSEGKINRDTVRITIEPMIIPAIRLRSTEGKDSLYATVIRKGYYYVWYWNDGRLVSTPQGENRLKVVTPGFYRVDMVNDNLGCVVSSLSFGYKMPSDSILPALTYKRLHCNSLTVKFEAKFYTDVTSADTVKSVTWNYGDGSSETLSPRIAPQHQYATEGTYMFNYTATTISGRTFRKQDSLRLDTVQYDLKITDDVTSIPGVHILKIKAPSHREQLKWNTGAYGDSIQVTTPGVYQVTFRDTCSGSTYAASIEIKPDAVSEWLLDAHIAKVSYCKDSVMLIAAPKAPTGVYTLEWNTGERTDTIYVTTNGRYVV